MVYRVSDASRGRRVAQSDGLVRLTILSGDGHPKGKGARGHALARSQFPTATAPNSQQPSPQKNLRLFLAPKREKGARGHALALSALPTAPNSRLPPKNIRLFFLFAPVFIKRESSRKPFFFFFFFLDILFNNNLISLTHSKHKNVFFCFLFLFFPCGFFFYNDDGDGDMDTRTLFGDF